MLWLIIIISIISLGFALYLARELLKKPSGTESMKEISKAVHDGALAFLHKEYSVLAAFILVVAGLLFYLGSIGLLENGKTLAVAFITGGIFSALAGNIGMRIATKANAKTAFAVQKSLNEGLKVAFSSGAVMGMTVVGLGLLGVSIFYLIYENPNIIYGFGFGASSIALFARVGGGIFTKAADVGADLVGKVEKGIPEDDPRNPAVIADNVGDNVGDIAGMGADLFESYVNAIIAVMVLGAVLADTNKIILPMAIAALGIIASIIGTFFVAGKDAQKAMNKGVLIASLLFAFGSFFVIRFLSEIGIFYAAVAGLAAGIVIGYSSEYYTSNSRAPAKSIAEAATTGAGTNVIQGLAVGMLSTFIPVIAIVAAMLLSYYFAGIYGVAIAGVGMLSTLGITLATDCYGPVADNAAGIAEMAKLGKKVRARAEELDAVGNTTAAIGKGFAIGSAALTALGLFASFTVVVQQATGKALVIDVTQPMILSGLFIGGLMPFLFSSLLMKAVGKSAEKVVVEVRKQFKQIRGLMEGRAKPDYNRCIKIVTGAALKGMIIPALLAIIVPLAIGLWSIEALGGLLVGVTASGFLMAIFMANAGGAWDNAKKYIEEGHFGGKGGDSHKASVVGDTVGDPLKDCSGPSLNILLKLMSIVALVFLPLFL